MKTSNLFQAAMVCLSFAAGIRTQAQDTPPQLRLTPGEIEFPLPTAGQTGTSGVGGLQVKVLSGDPKKAGLYTMVIKAGPNITIKPHAHPDNRVGVVVAGAFFFCTRRHIRREQVKGTAGG